MPRLNVIVLDQPSADPNLYKVVLWADVPAARQQYYITGASSAWTGATASDNTAIQSGAVAEKVTEAYVQGLSLAQVESGLQATWQAYQTYITNYNPWIHYGSTWDGTTWAVVTGL